MSGDEGPVRDRDRVGTDTHPSETGGSGPDTDWNAQSDGDTSTDSDGEPTTTSSDGTSTMVYVMDIVNSAGAVFLVGLLVFSVSGVYPPLVAIESPSMDPHIEKGDLVFVMEENRFPGPSAKYGVVTAAQSDDYVRFKRGGDVIVFAPDGNNQTTPIIHRAMLWVDEGENWYDRADEDAIGTADNCQELVNCPAPHAGFITKGDNNNRYDQVGDVTISDPVRPAWVIGTAELRIPFLGEIRLQWNQAGGSSVRAESVNRTAQPHVSG